MRYLPFGQQMRVQLNIIAFNCGPSENRLHSVELRSELCQSLWSQKNPSNTCSKHYPTTTPHAVATVNVAAKRPLSLTCSVKIASLKNHPGEQFVQLLDRHREMCDKHHVSRSGLCCNHQFGLNLNCKKSDSQRIPGRRQAVCL